MMYNADDWEVLEYGPSFGGTDLLVIRETLNNELSGNDYDGSLPKRASKISKMLRYSMGVGHWQVVFIKGRHARRLACSRNYFSIWQKRDGLRAYIWVNRFVSSTLRR